MYNSIHMVPYGLCLEWKCLRSLLRLYAQTATLNNEIICNGISVKHHVVISAPSESLTLCRSCVQQQSIKDQFNTPGARCNSLSMQPIQYDMMYNYFDTSAAPMIHLA
jgi:hypothetical protein